MAMNEKLANDLKLDERNHVEKPLLDQLAGLGWEIKDLDSKQHPSDTGARASLRWLCCPCCASS
jgi:type I restriction enzyme R subunit